ncbi:hypothetical protein TWF694_008605 [Orbilia ellipsospora]|uniref:Peptidase A1 domain-containing protein n=1 Tax=Orbilia ellipsospora TaxID=2528407 RepID=A0AAV9XGK4_9PEZI
MGLESSYTYIHHRFAAATTLAAALLVSIACATPNPQTNAGDKSQAVAPTCLNLGNCTNVDAWGLQVTVSGQTLCLVPSTVINATYVIGTQICNSQTNLTCQAAHGGTFDPNAAPAFVNHSTGNSGDESFWNDLNGPVHTFGDVEFSLSGFTQLEGFEIGVVENGTDFNLGQLGIGPKSTFLNTLKEQGFIDRLSFGFDAGSQSPYNTRAGHLVLGGYDQARVIGNFKEFDINYEVTTDDFRPCPFRVEIEQANVLFKSNKTSTPFIDMEARNPYACIEPYDLLFRFPAGRLASLDSIGLGSGRVADDWLPGLQVNEPGWRYKVGSPGAFSLDVVLKGNDGDFQVSIPSEELEHPLRGINLNGTFAVDQNYTELNIFQGSAIRNTIVLGKAFLSRVYLAVDYDAGKFYLAPSSPSLAGCNPVRFGDDSNTGHSSNRIAGYVGLAFAGLTFLIVATALGVAIWFWKTGRLDKYRRRGVNITERDVDCGTYMQQNTDDMRKLARQASLHPCSGSPDRQTFGSSLGLQRTASGR